MGRVHVRVPLVRHAELGERGAAIERPRPRIGDRGNAAAIRRDGAKKLHNEKLERRVGLPFGVVEVAAHRLWEAARAAVSPPFWLRRLMTPKIELPHWLSATKLWKHSKTFLFVEIFPITRVFEPVIGDRLVGSAIRPFSMSLSRARCGSTAAQSRTSPATKSWRCSACPTR